MKVRIIAVLLFLAAAANAQEKDHPLLEAYPGSTINNMVTKDYDEQIMLLSAISPDKTYKFEKVEGRVTRINYGDPSGRSALEKYRNYESALKQAGFQILWSCAGYEPCGPQVNIPGIGYFPYDSNARYLTARLKRSVGDVWIGLQVKPSWTDVQIVEVKPMDTEMVKISADALNKGILSEGRIAVYGIYFDTGKAEIKPESADTLKEIATLLQKNPELKLHVVGHTDNAGLLAGNLDLSKRRAAAVVTALTTTYKVNATRLRPDGVGPLAPVASNDTDAGKAKNRRVELVQQ